MVKSKKIGFIGLGLMGGAMVERLQTKGHTLNVLANRSRIQVDAAIARGATEVSSARDLAANSDIVMLCMDTSANVESRMRGGDGVIAGLRRDTVVIDFGTSLPASTKTLGSEVAAAGGTYLDAPLGRTPAHAIQGQLNILASGDKAAFDRVKPTLDDLGENVFHLGPLGTGHSIKLMNNFFGMTVANAMAEVFAIADIAGIERQSVYDVIAAGPLRSGMMDFVAAYALEGDDRKLEFAIKNARKDVGYYQQMTQDAGASSVMSQGAFAALSDAVSSGSGEDYVCKMVDYYSKKLKE